MFCQYVWYLLSLLTVLYTCLNFHIPIVVPGQGQILTCSSVIFFPILFAPGQGQTLTCLSVIFFPVLFAPGQGQIPLVILPALFYCALFRRLAYENSFCVLSSVI